METKKTNWIRVFIKSLSQQQFQVPLGFNYLISIRN